MKLLKEKRSGKNLFCRLFHETLMALGKFDFYSQMVLPFSTWSNRTGHLSYDE